MPATDTATDDDDELITRWQQGSSQKAGKS